MVSAPAAHLEVGGQSPATISLTEMACRLYWPDSEPGAIDPAVGRAAQKLVEIVATLRSPQAGWPADLPPTPENLAAYVADEAAELLAALAEAAPSTAEERLVLVSQRLPQWLWTIASSSYEVMRLLEGVKVRDYRDGDRYELRVVRLVPVLSFISDDVSLALDVVTQATPQPATWLPETAQLQLIEADLDGQSRAVADWLGLIGNHLQQVAPAIAQLLPGQPVSGLLPNQDWQTGQLQLGLHLADIGRITPEETRPKSEGFTLDDFAETLEPASPQTVSLLSLEASPVPAPPTIANAWITFSDDDWIQDFLMVNAWQDFAHGLTRPEIAAAELPLVRAAFEVVDRLQGTQGWLKHSFVHHSLLLADLWPRLRWYVTRRHHQLMNLMAGQPVQYLCPGACWQSGQLQLQVILSLDLKTECWEIDLATGSSRQNSPPALDPNTVIEGLSLPGRSGPQTLGELTATLTQYPPLPESFIAAVPVEVQRLEVEPGAVPSQLRLSWQFTIWPAA